MWFLDESGFNIYVIMNSSVAYWCICKVGFCLCICITFKMFRSEGEVVLTMWELLDESMFELLCVISWFVVWWFGLCEAWSFRRTQMLVNTSLKSLLRAAQVGGIARSTSSIVNNCRPHACRDFIFKLKEFAYCEIVFAATKKEIWV